MRYADDTSHHIGDIPTDTPRHTERYTVPEAARELRISPEAVRNRLSRGTLDSVKEHGRVYVLLDADRSHHIDDRSHHTDDMPNGSSSDRSHHTDGMPNDVSNDLDSVMSAKDETIRVLTEQLDAERAANRENRRLLAAALERIPAIEAPQDTRGASDTVSEGAVRGDVSSDPREPERRHSGWWRRFFGFD
jgi:hypothetical protein